MVHAARNRPRPRRCARKARPAMSKRSPWTLTTRAHNTSREQRAARNRAQPDDARTQHTLRRTRDRDRQRRARTMHPATSAHCAIALNLDDARNKRAIVIDLDDTRAQRVPRRVRRSRSRSILTVLSRQSWWTRSRRFTASATTAWTATAACTDQAMATAAVARSWGPMLSVPTSCISFYAFITSHYNVMPNYNVATLGHCTNYN